MSKRSNSRKLAMRMLYQYNIRETDLESIFDDLKTDQYAEETINWAFELASTTVKNLGSIDEIIKEYSIDWDPERLNQIDFALLRIGISEILYNKNPFKLLLMKL